MYSDGSQDGYDGYDHVIVNDNYFILNAYGIALHAPLAVQVTNMAMAISERITNGPTGLMPGLSFGQTMLPLQLSSNGNQYT